MEKYYGKGMIAIKDMKKYGEKFFTLKPCDDDPKDSLVWVLEGYDRYEKAYWVCKYNDYNHGKYIKGSKQVYVGFTF